VAKPLLMPRPGVHRARTTEPVGTFRLRIAPSPQAPSEARRAVDDLVGDSVDPRFAFYLRLVASELVKNALLHGSSSEPIVVKARLDEGRVDLQVEDHGGRLTLKRLRRRRRDGGRGLDIVDALVDAWTIESGLPGTRISVRMSTQPTA